ncbi:MAG: UDP-N-acetylmuramoyl-L-alanyl-D-glutamate--2,6-diaminopimelate ligase [Limnohabitans sp.]|nr:UDP-N-acetylmuramoyl-L-alanyl-D-glutamate--2,6-diaminopimelate ligase [Limnohabitans sp.]
MQALHIPQQAAQWLRTRVNGQLHVDSRRISKGDGFIAWPGDIHDGRQYVSQAIANGASACLVEAQGCEAFDWSQNPQHLGSYFNLKKDSGPIAAAYYENPSAQLNVLAVTGTNGKTSTAWWLAQALMHLGKRCGIVGTLGIGEIDDLDDTVLTTPDPVLLQSHLRKMVDRGVRACAIEASSIGLAEHRLAGTEIRMGIFTNFTQDHLDYHGTMQAYWQAKAVLFDDSHMQVAVINIDDEKGQLLAKQLAQKKHPATLWTVGVQNNARIRAQSIRHSNDESAGLTFDVVEGVLSIQLKSQMLGLYNVHNHLGVIASLRACGYELKAAVQACESLTAVPGRMQRIVQTGKPQVVIDYAHTPDALEKVLQSLNELAHQSNGKLICVVGCGGDRDKSKRAQMAQIAEQGSDRLVLTTDNPRSENPQSILDDMCLGLSNKFNAHIEIGRAKAIALSITQANKNDIVLIAGKGHENYQEVEGVRHHFSDEMHAHLALQSWERV